MENIEVYVSNLAGGKLILSSLLLSLFSLCLSSLSINQPGTGLVKHFRIFFHRSLLVSALMHICSSLTRLLLTSET